VLCAVLLAGTMLAGCGGGNTAADVVPKSTPNIIPPTDTSAEKAAAQKTSTSSTGAKGTTRPTGETASESETAGGSSEEASSEKSSTPEGGAAGGTEAEKEKAAPTESKGTGEASPTGGANAPSGK
jgi:hypothetical protein